MKAIVVLKEGEMCSRFINPIERYENKNSRKGVPRNCKLIYEDSDFDLRSLPVLNNGVAPVLFGQDIKEIDKKRHFLSFMPISIVLLLTSKISSLDRQLDRSIFKESSENLEKMIYCIKYQKRMYNVFEEIDKSRENLFTLTPPLVDYVDKLIVMSDKMEQFIHEVMSSLSEEERRILLSVVND